MFMGFHRKHKGGSRNDIQLKAGRQAGREGRQEWKKHKREKNNGQTSSGRGSSVDSWFAFFVEQRGLCSSGA